MTIMTLLNIILEDKKVSIIISLSSAPKNFQRDTKVEYRK
jgi:hypothetical protein